MIRKASQTDIDRIIDLHLNSFSDDHLSVLFSRKMLNEYFSILIKRNQFSYVYYNDDGKDLIGYVITGYETKEAVKEFIKKNRYSLMIVLLKNPKFLLEKIMELLRRNSAKLKNQGTKCRLYLIAIDSTYKGKGVGRKLISYLEEQLCSMDITEYGLSVRNENIEAVEFYNKLNYSIVSEDTRSVSYIKKI